MRDGGQSPDGGAVPFVLPSSATGSAGRQIPVSALNRSRKTKFPQINREGRSRLRENSWRDLPMHASLFMRGATAAGLVTLSLLFAVAAPNARAQDVTLEVWSHEADEPAKVAFR